MMQNIARILGNYWIGYYVVFVAVVLVLLYRNNWTIDQWDDIELMSNVFGSAVGYALFSAVVVEVLGRMVLLIPKTVRSLINRGRKEGRQAERKRTLLALQEARARGLAPDSPEFEKFILGFEPDNPEDDR